MPFNPCRRCGTCCRKGGPALHQGDEPRLAFISARNLVCLRPGEDVFDPRQDGLRPLEQDLLKIRGRGRGWECVYFRPEDNSCGIYTHRPRECRSLSCSDTSELFAVMDLRTLGRADLVNRPSALWDCIQEHEDRFPVASAMRLAREKSREQPARDSELERTILQERAFRQVLAERVQAGDEDLWAYLGRPLWLILLPLNRDFARYGAD